MTVLIENTTNSKLVCEHGFSLLIEHNGTKLLLDAGSTAQFADNAKAMGIALSDVNLCVLSHGHYDNSGGFERFFTENDNAKVYAQASALGQFFSGNGGMHEISVPDNVVRSRNRFELIGGFAKILTGIYLVPHNTENLDRLGKSALLYKRSNDGQIVPDDFAHEQSLVIDTPKGLVIFNSCSHGGVGNIIREVKQACGNKRVYAYIGGLHMKGQRCEKEICAFSDNELNVLCDAILSESIEYVYTGHCTGIAGIEKLKNKLGMRIFALTTGLQFEL